MRPPQARPADVVRLSEDVAGKIRDGHPWIFREALRGRKLDVAQVARGIEVIDPSNACVGRGLYDPEGAIALRVYSRQSGRVFDASHLRGAVADAAALRRGVLGNEPPGCYRVLNGDSEGVPAVNVDRYGGFLVVIAFSESVESYLSPLFAALEATWRPEGIYLQRRYRTADEGKAKPAAELVAGAAAPPELVVQEGRARFVVDVTAPLGTGLFADMRLGRAEVARYAGGRRVLNCFSYTGAFSVVAALNGARRVVSVDNAPRAHGRARRNLSENRLDPESRALEFVTGDVFATISRMADHGDRFEMVILDPPSFSSGGGKTRPFTSAKDYASLVTAAIGVIGDQGGLLCAATNTARLSREDFDRALARGATDAGRPITVISRRGQPADYPASPGFPEGSYLKFVVCQVG